MTSKTLTKEPRVFLIPSKVHASHYSCGREDSMIHIGVDLKSSLSGLNRPTQGLKYSPTKLKN